MIKNTVEYLNASADKFPEKTAFSDEKRCITYSELKREACKTAQALIAENIFRKPVAVYLKKSVECIAAFCGVFYSGNFYSMLDTEMPLERIEKILSTLEPAIIITDKEHYDAVCGFADCSKILVYEDVQAALSVDEAAVTGALNKTIDTDIAYVLFTSGSTGVPKGVIISHRALIDFIEWGTVEFGLDENCVFGNQTPLYFSMSVFDVYETLKNGGTMHIIPKDLFTLPMNLMQYLFDRDVNTVFWVPSALSIVSIFNLFDEPHLPKLKNVFFGGEVMPMKHLNKWIKAYPDCRYVNFYGPTEVTDTCTFYEVNRAFENTESLPMGFACRNMDVFLLDEDNRLITEKNTIGEVCVRGTGLAYGYYHNSEKTKEAFVQNPLNKNFEERIYRTGDLAQINDYGEFVYMSRKDFQIKHMGHRIELGEIEVAVSSINGVDENCCIYDAKKSRIILFYAGSADADFVMNSLKDKVPDYMMPNKKHKLDALPHNLNGKIDRQKLKDMI